MRICIATDFDILKINNRYYLKTQIYAVVKRYFESFGKVVFCGRLSKETTVTDAYEDVTEIIDSVVTIPSLLGIFQKKFKRDMAKAIEKCELVVSRCPGFIGYIAADYARKVKKPYLVECMGCAWDAYWNHGILGKMIAPYMFFKMKNVVRNADYALYVTNEFLQKRYPCKNESIGVSNVLIKNIDENVLQNRLKRINSFEPQNEIKIMTTAAVDVKYKGQEYVIKAIPLLNKTGITIKYFLVGGGDCNYLKKIAKRYGVENQIIFAGRVTLDKVFSLVDQIDIYIQPSLQEGLPRAVIEAMSRACPVLGACTAGIPELIEKRWVVKRKSHKDIAKKIKEIIKNKNMGEAAEQNFRISKEYLDCVLDKKRKDYFEKIKQEIG